MFEILFEMSVGRVGENKWIHHLMPEVWTIDFSEWIGILMNQNINAQIEFQEK